MADRVVPPQPPSLWWIYLLVVLALLALGAGAAQTVFVLRDLGDYASVRACLDQHGLAELPPGPLVTLPEMVQFADCTREFDRRLGVTMLVGAAAMPVAAGLLMLLDGVRIRLRLRQATDADKVRAATERFEAWCDTCGLSGRRRPQLLMTGWPSSQAFTTGFPLGRPLVVVPRSFTYEEQDKFDFVVLHEIAHVRARDVPWASAVWWAGWLSVPALLVAVLPLLSHPELVLNLYGRPLAMAIVLSVTVLVVRSALLRRRELAADHFAAQVLDNSEALRTASWFDPAQAEQAPSVGVRTRLWLRQMISLHPPPSTRLNPDPTALTWWEGGFVFTAAAGVVTMIFAQSAYLILINLLGYLGTNATVFTDLSLAGMCALWAAVVVPSWTRRAQVHPSAWWGPWAGAVTGLVGGYCLDLPGAVATANAAFEQHLPLFATVLAVVTFGVVLVATGVVARLTGSCRGPVVRALGLVGGVAAVAAMLSTAWGVTFIVLLTHLHFSDFAVDRALLWGMSDVGIWQITPFVLLGGLLLTMATTAERLPRVWLPVITVAAGIGASAAALSWRLRQHDGQSDGALNVLVGHQWWICAFAGAVVALAVWLTYQRSAGMWPAVPGAFAAGLVTTLLAGLLQFFVTTPAGNTRGPDGFLDYPRTPMWLLFVVTVIALPWLMLIIGLAMRLRLRAPSTGSIGLSGAGIFGVLTVMLIAGILSPVTGAADDQDRLVERLRQKMGEQASPSVTDPGH